MKNQQYQKIEDLLKDPSFTNWVKKTHASDIAFWENWIKKNPHHIQIVNDANDIINGIQFSPSKVSQEKVQIELEKLQQKIKNTHQNKHIPFLKKQQRWPKVAASIIFLLGVAGLLFWLEQPKSISHQTAFGEKIEMNLPDGTTDEEGNFDLSNLKTNTTFIVSYVGFRDQTISLTQTERLV